MILTTFETQESRPVLAECSFDSWHGIACCTQPMFRCTGLRLGCTQGPDRGHHQGQHLHGGAPVSHRAAHRGVRSLLDPLLLPPAPAAAEARSASTIGSAGTAGNPPQPYDMCNSR